MNATEIAALCANLYAAHTAADAAEDDAELFAVEETTLLALLSAQPATYEGCARKAAALLGWYDRAGLDNDPAVAAIVADAERLTGRQTVELLAA